MSPGIVLYSADESIDSPQKMRTQSRGLSIASLANLTPKITRPFTQLSSSGVKIERVLATAAVITILRERTDRQTASHLTGTICAMALINVLDIRFLNNPAPITDQYEIEIQFECLDSLAHDLEWKLIYVGSGFPNDVELDSLLVGPIPTGINKFVFTADAIDVTQMRPDDVLGVSVILLTASYDDREFVRVGFYSNNEYTDAELRAKYDALLATGTEEERAAYKFEGVKNVEVQRNILTAKPRVTRFNIKWDNENFNDQPPEQEEPDEEVVPLEELGEGEGEEEEEDDDIDDDDAAVGTAAATSAPIATATAEQEVARQAVSDGDTNMHLGNLSKTKTTPAQTSSSIQGSKMKGHDVEEDLDSASDNENDGEQDESNDDDDDDEGDDEDEEDEEGDDERDAEEIEVDPTPVQSK